MPRVRLTIRRLMIVVAVVAIGLGGSLEYRRLVRKATEYRARAEEHAGVERTLRMIVERDGLEAPIDISPGPGLRSVRFTAWAVAEFQAGLVRKYERAARYPWLSVEPDPQMPQRQPPGGRRPAP